MVEWHQFMQTRIVHPSIALSLSVVSVKVIVPRVVVVVVFICNAKSQIVIAWVDVEMEMRWVANLIYRY